MHASVHNKSVSCEIVYLKTGYRHSDPQEQSQLCGRVPKFMGSYHLWNDIIILSTIPKSCSADLVISLHGPTADLHMLAHACTDLHRPA